jgi:hypothetical protein
MIKLKDETRAILSDPELLEIQARYFADMESVYAGANDRPFVLSGFYGGTGEPSAGPMEEQVARGLDDLAAQAEFMRDDRVFRPLCFDVSTYGEDFGEYLFGLEKLAPDAGRLPRLNTPVGTLDPPPLETCPAWQNAKAQTEMFLELDLPLPLFSGSYMTSPLVEAVNLYSEDFLVAALQDPDAAMHDLRALCDVQVQMRKWYVDNVPVEQLQWVAPRLRGTLPGMSQIDGCTAQLVSPELYAEMIAPLDAESLMVAPRGGMIHICGYHSHHLPTWRNADWLRALQLSGDAMTDLPLYHNELRDNQVTYVSPHATMELEQIMEVTGGKRTIIALYEKDLHRVPSVVFGE